MSKSKSERIKDKERLKERYELTLKQNSEKVKKTNQILELEKKYNISFDFKKVLKNENAWYCVVYFVKHKNKMYHVISYKGAMTSLEDRVWKALYYQGPVEVKEPF